MNFLKLQRREGKTLQFMIKAKDPLEFETRLADCLKQGARLVNQGTHKDAGTTLHWAVLLQKRDV